MSVEIYSNLFFNSEKRFFLISVLNYKGPLINCFKFLSLYPFLESTKFSDICSLMA